MSDKTVYVWANPLKVAGFLDHTWVTTYDPVKCCPIDLTQGDYWYCWGICHETGQYNPRARLLDTGQAAIKLANCISNPNDKNDHAGITSWYGRYGVCHQVANRILFSTGSESSSPLLVSGAHGFWLSHLLYGNYGGKEGNWEEVQKNCGVINVIPNLMDLSPMLEMLQATMGADYSDAMIEPLRQVQQEMLAYKAELEARVEAGEMTVEQFAVAINQILAENLPRLADIIGIEYSRIVFGVEPGEEVYLIDIEIAAQSSET